MPEAYVKKNLSAFFDTMPRPNSVLREGEEFTGPTRVQGRRLYATTNQRNSVLVREQRGGRAFVTPAGKEFFSKWVAELLPRVPVKWIYLQGKVDIEGVVFDKFHEVPVPNGPDYLPLSAETFRLEVNVGREQDDASYFALGLVPYNGRSAQHEIEDASRERIREWMGRRPTLSRTLPSPRAKRPGSLQRHESCDEAVQGVLRLRLQQAYPLRRKGVPY